MGNAIYFCLESKLRVKEFICIISNQSWWCTEPKFTKLWPDQKTYRPYCYRFRILTLHHGCVFIEEMCVVVCLFLQTSNLLNPTDQTDA